MKFREIFRFELSCQFRQITVWIFFVGMLLFAGVANVVGLSEGEVNRNAPAMIAMVTVFGNLIWLLISGVIAGEAAARDIHTRMFALLYTSPISKISYFTGRFLAAFTINAFVQMAIPVGLLITNYAPFLPGMDPESLGPFRLGGYLQAYVFIALPIGFVATAMQFSFAIIQGRTAIAYLGSLLILIVSQFVSTTAGQAFGSWKMAQLLDVIGFISVARDLEGWSLLEKNTHLIGLSGVFLWNRLLWLGLALGVLTLSWMRFSFTYRSVRPWFRIFGRTRKRSSGQLEGSIPEKLEMDLPIVSRKFTFSNSLRQIRAIGWTSFRAIVRSKIWLACMAVFGLIVVLFASEFMEFNGVPLIPRTPEIISFLTASLEDIRSPLVIIPLLVIFYSGELIWREREARINAIVDTTPVNEWAFFLGKFLGLSLVIGVWMTILMLTGILTQAGLHYYDFEFDLYLVGLFGLQLPTYLLFALLALGVHTAVNQKYLGYLILLIILGIIAFAPQLGVEHTLLIYSSDLGWTYSDFRGFDPYLGQWFWYKFYWTAWALLLAVGARLLWVRSADTGFKRRLSLALQRLQSSTKWVAIAAALLVVIGGGFIFYNTNIINEYSTASERQEWRAEYERKYGHYADSPKPSLSGIDLKVDIFPEENRAEIIGSYQLVNNNLRSIDTIHIATASEVETAGISFNRPFQPVLEDRDLHHHIYVLKEPLHPGDSLQLNFSVNYRQNGFSNRGVNTAVVSNGSYFTNHDWLPAIGYQSYRELADAALREKFGLEERPLRPSLYDVKARYKVSEEQVVIHTVVSTSEDQTAIAPGVLQHSWTEDGRKYLQYSTEGAVKNGLAIFSASYEVLEENWFGADSKDVAIQIYHHPDHKENLGRMMKSVKASLDYYIKNYGPYPYSYIRLIERPGNGYGLHAEAATIDYREGFTLLNPHPEGLDLIFYVVGHEVAHQWSGAAQIIPAGVEGAIVMSESFACYSGLKVLEETYGDDQVNKLLNLWKEAYQVPRAPDTVPLMRALDPFLGYRVGPIALFELSKHVGDEKVNAALSNLVKKHGTAQPPLPTTLDLYRELEEVTPDSLQYLLYDLFKTNAYHE